MGLRHYIKRGFFVFLLPLLFLSSCTRKIQINTFADRKAIPKGFASGKTFFVFTEKENISLLSREISDKIAKILEEKGYPVKGAEVADYFLFCSSDIKSETHIVNIPVFVPGTTTTKQGNIYGGGSIHYNEQTQSSGKLTYAPQEITLFDKKMILRVYDANLYRNTQEEKLVWESLSFSYDQKSDLRDTIDYLILGTFHYFGSNTRRTICETIANCDKDVQLFRNSYYHPYSNYEYQSKHKMRYGPSFRQHISTFAQKTKNATLHAYNKAKEKTIKFFKQTYSKKNTFSRRKHRTSNGSSSGITPIVPAALKSVAVIPSIPVRAKTSSCSTPYYSGVQGYGEISKVNGLPRTNIVAGYYRSNGTYVRSYARSR